MNAEQFNDDVKSTNATESIDELYGDKDLRWYQIAARNEAVAAINAGQTRILIVLPTGAGKTLTVAASMSFSAMRTALGVTGNRPLRVMFVAHKHRLLTQAESTFVADSNVDLITQSMFSPLTEKQIKDGWDVCILDEAHHEACSSFQYQLESLGNKVVIGLTATPDRADGSVIKFETIINPISREDAVDQGFLAPSHIHTFVDVQSKDKVNVLTDIFNDYSHQMGQTMVFVKTKNEVRIIVQCIEGLGYTVVGILNQSERELNTILDTFSAGGIQFIVNCNKINEGVDVKGCTDVVLGRQFGSYPQLNQVIGRASRPDTSSSNIWELINPLSGTNLDTTVVVGTPISHRLVSKEGGKWVERQFDHITHQTNKQLGIAPISRVRVRT